MGTFIVLVLLVPTLGLASAVLGEGSPSTQPLPALRCQGPFVQGGAALCTAPSGTRIQMGGVGAVADADGILVVGFDRDAVKTEVALVEFLDGRISEYVFSVEQRDYAVSRIDGLPPSQVDSYSETALRRIQASSARKRTGDASRARLSAFRDRFIWPVKGRKTSSLGAQRILNGIEKRPHYGVDLAAPKGSTIVAPADGIVTLADNDLYFEGAMIVIDHGQGFLSKYLHVSRIDVEVGQRVQRGDRIGAVGSRGRSTGPHLCWRLKWRDRNLDPELWIE
jgi:murein DD-endopeptidase MepM/ murein hydrolase activator NlpD